MVSFLKNLFIHLFLFLAALGLRCCAWAFSSCCKWGLLFIAVHRLLMSVTSTVAAQALGCQGFSSHSSWAQWLQLPGSRAVVVAHGLSCSMSCGIFPDQGLNLRLLH